MSPEEKKLQEDNRQKMKDESRDALSRQLIKLGDMMGDGEHHEKGGGWINSEYKKVMRALHPEIWQERRKKKAEMVNESMKKLLAEKKCLCGGALEQSRSGSKVCYCQNCNIRYMAGTKKK